MASQPLMAFALLGLGVRQLSVGPRSVTAVKRIVRSVRADDAAVAARAALRAGTAAEAEQILREALDAQLGRSAARVAEPAAGAAGLP
jgi:phosphotransferase system enzyme I (PtsI)